MSLPRRLAVREIKSIARSPTRKIGLLDDGVTAPTKASRRARQFDKGKRLDQIVVSPCAQSPYLVVDFSERADDQERCGDAIITQSAHHRDAIDVRKHAVDRDHA